MKRNPANVSVGPAVFLEKLQWWHSEGQGGLQGRQIM